MIETVVGIIFGGIVSWIISHWYYKKQEESSPLPLITEVLAKIDGLYSLDTVKKDKELQNKLREINVLISNSHRKVLQVLLPLDIDAQALELLSSSGKEDSVAKYLNEFLPELMKFHEKYVLIAEELHKLNNETNTVVIP